MSKKEMPALNLKQHPADRIVMLLNMGFERDEIFADIHKHCEMQMTSKAARQRLANQIAQIDECNVMASGKIPKGF